MRGQVISEVAFIPFARAVCPEGFIVLAEIPGAFCAIQVCISIVIIPDGTPVNERGFSVRILVLIEERTAGV